MILYYACGGGYGHLARAQAVIATLGLHDVILVTASPARFDPRITGTCPVIAPPSTLGRDPRRIRSWLAKLLDHIKPREIILDVFPAGLLGEWCGLQPQAPITLIARRLRWAEYRRRLKGPPPQISHCWTLEDLEPAQAAWLRPRVQYTPLKLQDPTLSPDDTEIQTLANLAPPGRPLWLAVHSGPPHEQERLAATIEAAWHAEQSTAWRVAICPGATWAGGGVDAAIDLYPARLALPYAKRLFSGGGFNIMRESRAWGGQHTAIPFPRALDDQAWRIAHARQETTHES